MIFTRVVMIAGILLVCWCSTAEARPTIRITPVDTARFVKDQRFDIRVEFTPAPGHSLTAVTLAIDGVAQPDTDFWLENAAAADPVRRHLWGWR